MSSPSAPPATRRRGAAMAVAAVGVLGVFMIAVAGGGGDADTATAVPGEVEAAGDALPRLDDPMTDPAVGMAAPTVRGADFDGTPVVAPSDGGPTVVLFLAHWCPACQQEVPMVQGWLDEGGASDDVAFVAVSTGVDPARDNYPPDEWLEREGWTLPTLVDDDEFAAASAFGLPGYPFWVFLDEDGTVLGRHVGALSADDLGVVVERLAELAS